MSQQDVKIQFRCLAENFIFGIAAGMGLWVSIASKPIMRETARFILTSGCSDFLCNISILKASLFDIIHAIADPLTRHEISLAKLDKDCF